MNYSQQEHVELINAEEQRVGKEISICQEVKNTVESKGWKDTIEPLIDRFIVEVVGGKLGDTWVGGKLDRARKDERREYWIGYKQALIELHGRVMFHLQQLSMLEDRMKSLQEDKKERYRVPLVEDSRYRPEE